MDLLINEARTNKMKSQEFADLLWVLRKTGARPGEIRAAEAFNYESGKLIFRWNATKGYLWKNANKTQRDRIIYLTPDAQEYRLLFHTRRQPRERITATTVLETRIWYAIKQFLELQSHWFGI